MRYFWQTGSMTRHRMALQQVYADIDARNRRPQAQPDADVADLYTRALWTMGAWTIHVPQLFRDLQDFREEGLLFEPSGLSAELHWTLLQFQTFPVRPDVYNDAGLIEVCKEVLDRHPPIHIQFRGISRTRFGLFLNGYPNYDVNGLRDKLRHKYREACSGEMVEPHPQDIFHSTLFRFTREPSPPALACLDRLVSQYENVLVATMRPSMWEFGYGTWAQRSADRIVRATWAAKPALWILHRGLMAGPDRLLENKEALLKLRLQEGWDVEMDLWLQEGTFWLGHDTPESRLEDRCLLENPKAWIHCKNLEMLAYMSEKKPGAPFFSHDADPATLTSNGYIWCYPGFQAGAKSILVMPERVPALSVDYTTVAGICSDYVFRNL